MATADEWVQSKYKKLKKRLDTKLSFCKCRYQRIRYSVYEKRLEELNRHTGRFERHQKVSRKRGDICRQTAKPLQMFFKRHAV